VTDTSDLLIGGDLHGSFRHVHGRPELVLIAVRIGEANDSAFITLTGCLYRIRVRDFVLIEPAQV
jgi:hypothetical protein